MSVRYRATLTDPDSPSVHVFGDRLTEVNKLATEALRHAASEFACVQIYETVEREISCRIKGKARVKAVTA